MMRIGILLVALAWSGPAIAGTVWVANNGTDSGICGGPSAPCRTITQGIENAGVGDTIKVGPGTYGDVDGDDVTGEPGEEPYASCGGPETFVCIRKGVKLESTHGAHSTIIRAAADTYAAVHFLSGDSGGRLGKRNKGFTVTGAVGLYLVIANQPDAIVEGNVLVPLGSPNGALSTHDSNVTLRDNLVICSEEGYGFDVRGIGPQVIGNRVSGCSVGFEVRAQNWSMVGNVASGNYYGMSLIIWESSSAHGPVVFDRNSFIGNRSYGIYVHVVDASPASLLVLRGSNVFGNDPRPFGNCGIGVENNDETDLITVEAVDFFWGAPSLGPGGDPSDETCVDPFGEGPPVNVTALGAAPPKPYVVKPKPLR